MLKNILKAFGVAAIITLLHFIIVNVFYWRYSTMHETMWTNIHYFQWVPYIEGTVLMFIGTLVFIAVGKFTNLSIYFGVLVPFTDKEYIISDIQWMKIFFKSCVTAFIISLIHLICVNAIYWRYNMHETMFKGFIENNHYEQLKVHFNDQLLAPMHTLPWAQYIEGVIVMFFIIFISKIILGLLIQKKESSVST